VLTGVFLSALFALGVMLGTVVSGYAASLHYLPMLARPGVNTTLATQSSADGTVPGAAAAVDAHFAIVTLGIRCLRDRCDTPDASQYVPAGQRIYALEGEASCTTMSAAVIVGQRTQAVYCRLDQPNVYVTSFDGAPFDCVGSRLGCHFVVRVETTNGR
jgi:hypothetical protein